MAEPIQLRSKQPSEKKTVILNFSPDLKGAAISSAIITATDRNTGDSYSALIGSSAFDSAKGEVSFLVQGGTDGGRYKITVLVNSKYEQDLYQDVVEH